MNLGNMRIYNYFCYYINSINISNKHQIDKKKLNKIILYDTKEI